jgi:2-haloacid dehalogenase
MSVPWVTFDCYGTLVDWNSSFSTILRPLFAGRTPEVMAVYHRMERLVEAEISHKTYRSVLATSLQRATSQLGIPITREQADYLSANWTRLEVFPDVEPALEKLRGFGCRLGVLTNCDEDLFAETHRKFRKPFDLVVTAERVKSYKPSLDHFRTFQQLTGAGPADWIHAACSWFHDIAPARELGLRSIWLDRDRTGEDPGAASICIESASELPTAVQQLLGFQKRDRSGASVQLP